MSLYIAQTWFTTKKIAEREATFRKKSDLKMYSSESVMSPLLLCFQIDSFGKENSSYFDNFYNSSSIKAFRVSSATSSNFRLIDMVYRISDIQARRYCTSVPDKLWYSEHVRLTVLTTYPASVVGVGMYYKTLAYWIFMKSSVLKN